MKRPTKIIIGAFAAVVAAWGAASLYFTVAGRDSSGDCLCEYLPPRLDLSPGENAYAAIKTFTDNLPTNNTTLLATDYRLRKAYLDGATNRLDFADAAREYLAAEAPTIAAAKGILASRGIVVEKDEVLDATGRFCTLMRIGNVYKVKATYEASSVDLATGRASLMELHDVGRFLMDADSLAYGISALIGEGLCNIALYAAANPLFAPEDDEAWRVHLRDLARNDMAGDAERWKRIACRSFAGYTRAEVEAAAKNRNILLGVMYGKTLGDLLRLGSDMSARSRLQDDPWGNTERNFLFVLLISSRDGPVLPQGRRGNIRHVLCPGAARWAMGQRCRHQSARAQFPRTKEDAGQKRQLCHVLQDAFQVAFFHCGSRVPVISCEAWKPAGFS